MLANGISIKPSNTLPITPKTANNTGTIKHVPEILCNNAEAPVPKAAGLTASLK